VGLRELLLQLGDRLVLLLDRVPAGRGGLVDLRVRLLELVGELRELGLGVLGRGLRLPLGVLGDPARLVAGLLLLEEGVALDVELLELLARFAWLLSASASAG